MNRFPIHCLPLALAVLLVMTVPQERALAQTPDWASSSVHMRLAENLDRPRDGWCLDVVGSGQHIRFDMPLIGHNCKPGLYADEAVRFESDGRILFPAYGAACVTAMGLNKYALPGAALMLRPCGVAIPFLEAQNFQYFDHLETGAVRLRGTDLCITMGDESRETFDPTHAWRTLYLERCGEIDPKRAHWVFRAP